MGELITPGELPRYVPGELTVNSAELGWEGVELRGYRYGPSDVPVPPLKTYAVIAYQGGKATMHRRCTSEWRTEHVGPGCVSLLTHSMNSHWRWTEKIEVAHLYVSSGSVAEIAAEAYGRNIRDIELFDVLKAEDAVLSGIAASLAREAREAGVGGRLYVDALRNQACIHMLRHYASVAFREPPAAGGLSHVQCRALGEYIDANLDRNISLAELAGVAQLSVFHFIRKFSSSFGCPPHAYVMRRRIEQAKRQLARRNVPLKVVAANCGFADQSHMTRTFRRALGITPAEYRSSVTA